MANGHCSECGGNINLGGKPRKGQVFPCVRCGARMVVLNLSPVELDLTYDEDSGDGEGYDHYLDVHHNQSKY